MIRATVPQGTTAAKMLASVRREIKMRERVYPRWVEAARMTQANADEELATMRAVLTVLEQVLPLDVNQIELFSRGGRP